MDIGLSLGNTRTLPMTTISPATLAAAKKKLVSRIGAAQRQADTAKKAAKATKLGFKQAKQKFKDAKKAAKKIRKNIKTLKAELAALATKKPARNLARKSAPKRVRPDATIPAAVEQLPAAVESLPSTEGTPLIQ